MLIWILIGESICLNDAREEVREIAKDSMVELEKQNAKLTLLLSWVKFL
jgi:hypothetical protein